MVSKLYWHFNVEITKTKQVHVKIPLEGENSLELHWYSNIEITKIKLFWFTFKNGSNSSIRKNKSRNCIATQLHSNFNVEITKTKFLWFTFENSNATMKLD